MTDQMVNIPLLRKAVEWAEAEAAKPPELCQWRQGRWVSDPREVASDLTAAVPCSERTAAMADLVHKCGTAYCIAGYVASSLDERYGDSLKADGVPIGEFAADALGIDRPRDAWAPERGRLFHSDNTIEDVRHIAEELAGERL